VHFTTVREIQTVAISWANKRISVRGHTSTTCEATPQPGHSSDDCAAAPRWK